MRFPGNGNRNANPIHNTHIIYTTMISLAFRFSIHGNRIVVGAEGNETFIISRKHSFHLHRATMQFPANGKKERQSNPLHRYHPTTTTITTRRLAKNDFFGISVIYPWKLDRCGCGGK
jgi:hypothetical protein